jgi:membrane protein insertase Oxa1/YidC/SpoIIIJ
MTFLDYFDLTKPSIILGILAAITQYLYMEISMPDIKLNEFLKTKTDQNQQDMMKNFQIYMKYGLPIMIFFMGAFTFKAGLTLY